LSLCKGKEKRGKAAYHGASPVVSAAKFYDYDLVLEKYRDLDVETVREAIKHYKEFQGKCEKRGLSVHSVYKKPREWNDNQRYYVFEFGNAYCNIEKEVHIPSSMQHKPRIVCDFMKRKIFDEVVAEADRIEEETRPQREAEEKRRKEKNAYQASHTIPDLAEEDRQALFAFLEKELEKSECDGTLRLSREWLHTRFNDPEKELAAEIYLEKHGGFCDCEVIMNVKNN